MNRDEPCLRVRDLSFSYPDYPGLRAQQLFEGLDLELQPGSIAVLLGAPDSGKTTLCRILAGLVPRFSGGALGGAIRLPGGVLAERAPYELVEEVGLVFQNPADQLFASRCDLEVAFALESLGLDPSEIEARVERALAWMGLERMRGRNPLSLSGGEKKKLLLACLHAVDPPLWLLDETLEELDSTARDRLLSYLKAEGKSVLIPSAKWHDLFGRCADQVVLLEGGRLRPLPAGADSERAGELERAGLSLPLGPRSRGGVRRPPTTAATLIEVEDLSFCYPGEGSFRLEMPRFAVRAGEVVALIGPNGSGKTTLGRILCGLLEPQEGRVKVPQGGRLLPAGPELLNRHTGYLFQDPDLQIFLPTVAEELAYGLRLKGLDPEAIRQAVREASDRFHLPDPEVPPALMSYGARKRLQAAVCHLLERPLLVIDEGDSGLGALEFAGLLAQFRSPERGLVFITHDMELAARLADRLVELREGRPQ